MKREEPLLSPRKGALPRLVVQLRYPQQVAVSREGFREKELGGENKH